MPFEESQASTHKQSKGRIIMKADRLITSVVALAALTVIVTSGTLGRSQRVQKQNDDDQKSRIERGFQMAPVPLNLEGKNRELVGLGSYLVNAVASCNDCHSAGSQTQFAPGGNPFFGQPTKINPATYMGGGQDFGPLLPTPGSPHIVSRNLTPDKTGLPKVDDRSQSFAKSCGQGRIWITCIRRAPRA
jgi:hypothetical protein